MPFLKSVEVVSSRADVSDRHPFDVPAIAAMITQRQRLRLDRSVTVFVGDNGSGKSTLLEAVAVNQGMNAEGGARGMQFRTHESTVSKLHECLRVNRSSRQPSDAFFLRAESFFNVATAIEEYGSQRSYGGSPHDRSHGESFIDLVVHRFGPHGLYLLDEPEAALSVHGQLQLLVRIHDLVRDGCQFVIATHSPMLMAYPDAAIYEFSDRGVEPSDWSEIDTVQITSEFLRNPEPFLTDLFDDSQD